jgi:hypothetical protein
MSQSGAETNETLVPAWGSVLITMPVRPRVRPAGEDGILTLGRLFSAPPREAAKMNTASAMIWFGVAIATVLILVLCFT